MEGGVIGVPGVLSEGFDNPAYGDPVWQTLFSAGLTPTDGMCAGVMELAPSGGFLAAHRHPPAEIYFVAAGEGVLSLEGVETLIRAGTAVFIKGNALHALRNERAEALRVFYVFPTGRFSDIVYAFE